MNEFKHIWIVEDEPLAAERLMGMIRGIVPDSEVHGPVDTTTQAIEEIDPGSCDLLFLDVQLADGLSFRILEKMNLDCPIIFTTAFDQYALDAFKFNGIDYILKPISQKDLEKAFEKAKRWSGGQPLQFDLKEIAQALQGKKEDFPKRIVVKLGQQIKAIEIDEIAYLYNDNKTVMLRKFTGKDIPLDNSLDHWSTILDPAKFHRINRKMLVSFRSISKMGQYSRSRIKIDLEPAFEEMVLVSGERVNGFRDWLSGY